MVRCNSKFSQALLGMLALFLLSATSATANVGNYSFSSDPTALSNPTADLATTVFGPGVDDELSSVISLPFTFYFNAKPYDRVVISSNGWVGLGSSSNSPVFPGTISSVPTNDPEAWQFSNTPLLAPLWDDLRTAVSNSGVSYASSSDEFRVRWRRCEWGPSNIFVTFDLVMNRVNNQILFTYGTGTNSALQTATVGVLNDADASAPDNYQVFNGDVVPGNTTDDAAANLNTRLISFNNLPAGASIETPHYTAIYVQTPSLDFGSVNADGGTSARGFTMRNVGSTNISVSDADVFLSGSTQYSVNSFAATITPGGTFTPSITFTGTCPLTLSPINGSAIVSILGVTVCYPVPNTSVALSGTEEHPALTVGPLDSFGSVALGSSDSRTIVLGNFGNSTYTGTLSLSGTGSNQFSISPNPVSVGGGDATIVTVTFTPDGTTHAANAVASSWQAFYSLTLTIPEGNQTCNGGTIATRGFSANSTAPRVSIAVPFSTDIPNNQATPEMDLGNRVYQPSLADVLIPMSFDDDLLVVNTGSSPLTINSINNAFAGNLSNRYGANATLVSGNPTLNPGDAAAYRINYSPQTTTSDFPNPSSSSSQGSTFGVEPADVTGNTTYQFDIDASTPVPSDPGYWHDFRNGAGSTYSPAENLVNSGQVSATIDMHRGYMRTVNTPANASNQAPTDPNGAPMLNGGLVVDGSSATNVGNGSNGGNSLQITSYWGLVGDVLPNGAVITQAGQPGVTSFYVVNNGNANARFWVRQNMEDTGANPGAFSLSVPILGDPGILVSTEVIGGVSYHAFTLEPLFIQPSGNNKAFVRFDITFAPNRSNTPDVNTIADQRSAEIAILTDASFNPAAGSSTDPRNDANPYIIEVQGTSLFNDPLILVDAGLPDERLVQDLDFGIHELADGAIRSSEYPFGSQAPSGIGYSATAEFVGRFGLPTGPAGPRGYGVGDTAIQVNVRNLGNAGLTYNNISDLQAFSTLGTGLFEIVRVTTPQNINSASLVGGPSTPTFPFTLNPWTGGGTNQELVLWVRFDVRNRSTAPVGNLGLSRGQVRSVQSTLSDPALHTTSISYDVEGSAIRPFPIVDINGGTNGDQISVIDGPARVAPVHEAWRVLTFDNYCNVSGLGENRDSVHIPVTIGNGNPAPTLVGNANDVAVSPVWVDVSQATVDSLNAGGLWIPATSKSFFIEYNESGVIRNQFGTVVDGNADITNPILLQPNYTLTFHVAFRPTALTPPGFGSIDAVVRVPHSSRNTNLDYPSDDGPSQTNASSENGDVYKMLEMVVRGNSLRPAIRLERGNNAINGILSNYVAPNSTLDDFNLPYAYLPGTFVGDSSFVAFTLRNSQETGNIPTGVDASTGLIGIEEIIIDGVDFPDFEVVGFGLEAGVTQEPNPVLFPINVASGALASGTNFIQWVANVPPIGRIGTPYYLDRRNGDEAVSLYIHFKPRRRVNGATKDMRNAVLRIKTTDVCQPEIVYNLQARALDAELVFTPTSINFGNIQQNDVAQEMLEFTNVGNSPAYFSNVPNMPGTPLYSHRFNQLPLGFSIFTNHPPITFNIVGDTQTPLFPGNTRAVAVQYSPQDVGLQDGILSVGYVPEVPTSIANGNIAQIDLRGRGVAPISLTTDPANGILDFGNVFVGQRGNQSITITNPGAADLVLQLPPSPIGPFSHSLAGQSEITLGAGQDAVVTFWFDPLALGFVEATFTITVPDAFGDQVYDIITRGTGVSATALSRSTIDYGITRVFTDNIQNIFVNNSGGINPAAVIFNGIVGPHASEYTFRLNGNILSPGYNFVVGAGSNSVDHQIVFSPNVVPNPVTAANIRTAEVQFLIDGTPVNVSVSGDGAVPQIAFVNPAVIVNGTVDFGVVDQALGAQRNINVTNIGRFPLDIATLEVQGPNASEFAVSNIANTLLNGGQSVNVTVTLIPGSSTATLNAFLSSVSNSLNPRTLNLTGSRAIPQLVISSAQIDFGKLKVGQSQDRFVSITNVTGKDIDVNAHSILGSGASQFKVTGTTRPLPATLAPGEEITYTLQFVPTSIGDKVANLTIATSTGQREVDLYGRVVESGIVASAQSLNFGSVPVGKTRELNVSVTNNEDVAVQITEIEIYGDHATMFTSDIQDGFSMSAGESRAFNISFTPDDRGAKVAFLRLRTNVGEPILTGLVGSGGAPAISVQDLLRFEERLEVGQSQTKDINVTNNGDTELEITDWLIDLGAAEDFAVVAGIPATIQPGQSAPISVRFAPLTEGSHKTATLKLMNNTNVPGVIDLLGSTFVTDVPGEGSDQLQFGLGEAYPNPFIDQATISYGLTETDNVTITVVNQLGVEVIRMPIGIQTPGSYRVTLDAAHLPAGAYIIRLEAGENVATAKATKLK